MAFIFTMHSHRRDMPSTGTLPAISEDGGDFTIQPDPKVKPRTPPTRPPWARNPGSSPLSYTSMSDTSGSDTDQEKHLANLRNNPIIAKRGGWKRLALIALVVTLCIVGLIVGLVIGLRQKNSSSGSSSDNSSNSTTTDSTAFPAGSFAIQTYLSSVTTNCTSNPYTWRCYPYTTYDESTTLSAATFSWIISMNTPATNPATYSISSTQNPFSIVFSSMPLTLKDPGLSTEHYSFVLTSMNKPVIPSSAITSNNVATTCYFNETSLEARLYTKMTKTYPSPSSSPSSTTATGQNGTASPFAPWPYAAYIDQTDAGGPNVPQCFDNNGNKLGYFADETGGECSCLYQNYGT